MDIDSIRKKQFLFYESIHFKGAVGLASRIYHKHLEIFSNVGIYEKILEVGAGAGEHFPYVRNDFQEYILSDIRTPEPSPHVMNSIVGQRNNGKSVFFDVANLEDLKYENSSFDRVISTCVFHHLDKPLLAAYELRRVTKNNGLISIYLPSDPGILYRMFKSVFSGRAHRKYLSKKELNFFRSVEHRNHVASLSEIFDGVFESDVIKKSNFPKFGITWNLRLFQIWNIKVNK